MLVFISDMAACAYQCVFQRCRHSTFAYSSNSSATVRMISSLSEKRSSQAFVLTGPNVKCNYVPWPDKDFSEESPAQEPSNALLTNLSYFHTSLAFKSHSNRPGLTLPCLSSRTGISVDIYMQRSGRAENYMTNS